MTTPFVEQPPSKPVGLLTRLITVGCFEKERKNMILICY